MINATQYAFLKMKKAFTGEAERLNLKNEQDVVNMVDEIRQELWNERSAGHD